MPCEDFLPTISKVRLHKLPIPKEDYTRGIQMQSATPRKDHTAGSEFLAVLRSERTQLRTFAALLQRIRMETPDVITELRALRTHAEEFLIDGHLPTLEMGLLAFLSKNSLAPEGAVESMTMAISQVEDRLAQFSTAVEASSLGAMNHVARSLRVLADSLLALALEEEELLARYFLPVLTPAIDQTLLQQRAVQVSCANALSVRQSLCDIARV